MKPVSSHAMPPAPSGASRRGFLGLLGGALVATGASLATKTAVAAPHASAAALPIEAPVVGASSSVAPTSIAPSLRTIAGGREIFTMLDPLSLDAFSGQLNTHFHVPDANISLELVKASDTSRGDNVRSFQLILVGPLEPVLAPETHLLRHAALGDMALFISPFKQDESGTRYHISFSHLLD